MADREIKTALGTYVDENGVSQFGLLGDKVKVHADHVARFDEFNVENGDGKPADHPREAVETVAPGQPKRRARSKDDGE